MGWVVLWVGYGFLEKNMGFIYFKSEINAQPHPVIHPPPMFTQYEYHTLPYKYHPLLPPHTDSEMILVICGLIDKLSRSLGGDHDSGDSMISDIFNKVIVGVNKGSKATCN